MSQITLYIATSQDGFIADKNGGVDWLPQPKNDAELEALGYKALMSRSDTILMGSHSYKQILGFGDWPWPDKQTYVFSSQALESSLPSITITQDSPRRLMQRLKERKSAKDLWLLGGAALANSFAREGLIDEIILTLIPQVLGEGIALGLNFENFDLVSERSVMAGISEKIYLRKNKHLFCLNTELSGSKNTGF